MTDEPLSADERAAALAAAGAEGRFRPLGVERAVPGRRSPPGERRAVVLLHDRESGRSSVAAVDLDRDEVVARHETPARFQLARDEEDEAERLAAADGRIAAFLRGRPLNPLTRLYFPPDRDAAHRYAIVFARPTTYERRYAVVDLTDGRVAEVLGPEHLAGE